MVYRLKPFLLAVLVFAPAFTVWGESVLRPWQPLFKGIEHAVGTNFPNTVFVGSTGSYTNKALQVVHCLRVDLGDPDVQLLPTPPAPNPVFDSRETLTAAITTFILSNRVQVAVNAGFYNANPGGSDPSSEGVSCDEFGLFISRGVTVSPIGEGRYATMLFRTNNQPLIAFDNRAPGISTTGIFSAVSGFYPVVSNGMSVAAAAAISYPDGSIHGPQPRMIYGVSQDRRWLLFMSIDGRQSGYSDGATDEESAWWGKQVGMWDAINMDGGGSAAMYRTDTNGAPVALNRSSYRASTGRERYIGSHFGVYAPPLSTFITGLSAQASYTSAALSWRTVSNATTRVEYGFTPAYGSSTTLDSSLTTNHTVSLTGLSPGTNYYFRAISTLGTNVFVSASSFRTLDFVANVTAQPGLRDATITWDTPWPSTSQVEYGLTVSYGNTSSFDNALVTHHVVTLNELQPGTTYYFQALSQTGSGTYGSSGVVTTSNYPPVLAFDMTNTWRYATGNLDGIAWQTRAYNDSSWGSGPGLLWADNRGPNASIPLEATSMPLNPTTGYPFITYYFRTHFQFPASPAGATLVFSNYLDDGAVFYLNGAEIYRAFMAAPPAVIASSTLSSSYNCSSGNATCPFVFTIAGDAITNLISGDNVLAVEVHNYNPNSADITFGAALLYTAIPGDNAPPVLASIGNKSGDEGTPLTFVASATDPDTPPQQLTYALDPGAPAAATINPANGAFAWTPAENDGPGVYTVTVRVTDNGSPAQSDSESITITVNEANRAPTLNAITDQTITELATLNVTNVASDADVPAHKLTFALVNGPSGLSVNETSGVLSWNPTEAQGPSTNTVVVRVFDNGTPSLSATQSFKVFVNETNTEPALNPLADRTITELTTLNVTNVASDPDLPAQALTFALVSAPTGVDLDGSSGLLSWTPTGAQGPSTNTIVVRVFDSGTPSLSATQSFKVFVNELNSPPTLQPLADRTIIELSTLNITNVASDTDVPAQTLTFVLVSGPSGVTLDGSSGVLTWTPTEAQGPSTNTIVVRVFDSGIPSLSATQSFTVFVNELNSAPFLSPLADQAIAELSTLTITNVASDTGSPAQTLTFALVDGPSGMNLDGASGVLTWTPSEAQGPSTNTIVVRVFDSGTPSLSATQSFTVVVSEVNSAPVFPPSDPLTITEGALLSFTVAATDADLPLQVLRYTLETGAPSGAALTETNGFFSWRPPAGTAPSTNIISIRATDNGTPEMSELLSLTIVVVAPPRLTIALSSSGLVTLTWNSLAGRSYRVEYSDSDESPNGPWSQLGEDVLADSTLTTATDQADRSPRRIYRVRLEE
jgi:hypothetical protein